MRKVSPFFLLYYMLYSCKDKRAWVEKNYYKIERQVAMREGGKLVTAIFILENYMLVMHQARGRYIVPSIYFVEVWAKKKARIEIQPVLKSNIL